MILNIHIYKEVYRWLRTIKAQELVWCKQPLLRNFFDSIV